MDIVEAKETSTDGVRPKTRGKGLEGGLLNWVGMLVGRIVRSRTKQSLWLL